MQHSVHVDQALVEIEFGRVKGAAAVDFLIPAVPSGDVDMTLFDVALVVIQEAAPESETAIGLFGWDRTAPEGGGCD